MNTFHLTIVTPVGKILDQEVGSVSAPGAEGAFAILANHTPFVTTLKSGTLKVRKTDGDNIFTIDSGILEVTKDKKCLILANHIEPAK